MVSVQPISKICEPSNWIISPIFGIKIQKYLSCHHLHPQKLTWNLEMMVSNRNLLFQGSIFRFHVCFGGCSSYETPNSICIICSPDKLTTQATRPPGWRCLGSRTLSGPHEFFNEKLRFLKEHQKVGAMNAKSPPPPPPQKKKMK